MEEHKAALNNLVDGVNGLRVENGPKFTTKLRFYLNGTSACTLMISSYDKSSNKITHCSVNACLAPLCSVDGKHVITIEGIGNVENPHPVQCGFCTPGIAMSLYSLLRNNPNPSEKEIEECFDDCCKLNNTENDTTFDLKFPQSTWFRPVNLSQLLYLKSKYPYAKLISGNTEVGIEIKFKKLRYDVQIFVGDIPELKTWEFKDDGLLIGANISLSTLQEILQDALKRYEPYQTQIFKALLENLRWFAGNQIRNVATPAGNIVTGSPISDLNPIFLSSKTLFILSSLEPSSMVATDRTVLSESFWTGYRQNCCKETELLKKIFIPFTKQGQYIRAYKQAKRRDDDIAIVNAGLSVLLDDDNSVKEASFAFGGMSWVTVRAPESENFVLGKKWGDQNVLKGLLEKSCEFWYDVSKSANIIVDDCDGGIENFVGIIERDISKGKKIVGKQVPHVSAMKQVTGEAKYTDDIPKVHGELYGALVLSQKAHAKILGIDATEALAQPGVKGFFSAKDVPGNNIWGPVLRDEEVFASEEVNLVAETQAIAQEAVVRGDVEKGLEGADFVFEGMMYQMTIYYSIKNLILTYTITQVKQELVAKDNEFEIHSSTQNPTETQLEVASALGIDANKIVCRVKRLGGGFGGKETRSIPLSLALAVGAWHLKKPIRCMLDRDEDIIISGQRHPFLGRWKVGVTKDGKLLAMDVQVYNNGGWSADLSLAVLERGMTHLDNCYYVPNVRITGHVCKTNIHSNTAFRGFGGPQGMMITENMMSEVADRMGIDVNDFREKNLYVEGQKTHFNQILKDWNIPLIYRQVKNDSEFVKRREEINKFNSENKWRKRGLALIPTKFGISYTALHLNQAGALVHIYHDGSVLISGVEMGQGLHTKMLQIAAETLDVPLETVGNTSATAASVSSDINGYAVSNACKTLVERLKPYREKMPNKSFKEIVHAAYFDRVNLSANGYYKTPDIGYNWDKNEGQMFFYFTMGVACTEVEIDVLTGDHTILRTDLCMDIGRSINYAIDVGQIEGAFVQ
ncbi:9022_t:CDS:10, partial [Racocetra fulgida]